jgi:hypothetical protein
MFGGFSLSARKHAVVAVRRFQPRLEHLETRECPSITLSALNIANVSGRTVQISGTVQDDNPATVVVSLTGVVSGTVNPNASGAYSFTADATSLGMVTANAVDAQQQQAQPVKGTVSAAAPQIKNFAATWISGTSWRFTGQVVDASPSTGQVQLSGLPSLQGVTVTPGADGTFSVVVVLGQGETGMAHAQATDCWGQQSDQVDWTISY